MNRMRRHEVECLDCALERNYRKACNPSKFMCSQAVCCNGT